MSQAGNPTQGPPRMNNSIRKRFLGRISLSGRMLRRSCLSTLLTAGALATAYTGSVQAQVPCDQCPPHPFYQQGMPPQVYPYPGVNPYQMDPQYLFGAPYMAQPYMSPYPQPIMPQPVQPQDPKKTDPGKANTQQNNNNNNNNQNQQNNNQQQNNNNQQQQQQNQNQNQQQNNLPDNPQNNNQPNQNNFQNNQNTQTAQAPSTQSSAAPNMIGDYRESPFFYSNGFNNVTLPQQGIVRLDFSQNTNPIPVDRFYMNYHHYRNAFSAQAGVVGNDLLFFGTLVGPGSGGVADGIAIDTISRTDFEALAAGGDPAAAEALTSLFGFEVFDPSAFLDSDALVADGFDSANLDIFYLGVEKTFARERASVEFRLPIVSAPNQDLDARADNLQSLNGYQIQMGNISLLLKSLLLRDYTGTFTVSGGLGFTIPTGPDFRIRDSDILIPDQNNVNDATALANLGFTPDNYVVAPSDYLVAGGPTGRQILLPGNDITVRNRAMLITPFLAFTQQYTERLSTQLYFQGDFVATENTISSPNGHVAKIKQQDTFKVDYQMKYWFFRKPDLADTQTLYINGVRYQQTEGARFKGLAGLFELHGTTALIDPDSAGNPDLLNDPSYLAGDYLLDDLTGTNLAGDPVDLKTDRFFASSNNNRRLRSLNITTGLQADLADAGTVTFAVAVPLVEQAKGVNLFDSELIFQYNMFY
ncbi:MAG: hypothetical protein KDA78_05170 [Planctomycetaceae bacterium]|nr:hypothetical protein [Planctomycetaceae bacterium]